MAMALITPCSIILPEPGSMYADALGGNIRYTTDIVLKIASIFVLFRLMDRLLFHISRAMRGEYAAPSGINKK